MSFLNVTSEIIFMFTIVAKIQIDEMERYIKYFDFKRMTKNFVHGILASLKKKSLKENFQQKQE